MPEHDAYLDEIPAYVADRLSEEARARLETHLSQCPDCADLTAAWREVATGLRNDGEALLEPHPGEMMLRAHALRGESPAGAKIARHLDSCASCRLEVDVWKAMPAGRLPASDASLRTAATSPPGLRRSARAWAAGATGLAAGLVLGFVLGPLLTMGTKRAPGTTETGTLNGPVQLLLLSGSLRGQDSIPTLPIERTRTTCLLALQASLPENIPAETAVRFVLSRDSGEEVWSSTTTAGWIRVTMESSGVATLAVPTQVLSPGGYTIRLRAADGTGAPPLVEVPFRLIEPPER